MVVMSKGSQSCSPFRTREYPVSEHAHIPRVLRLLDVVSFGVSSTIGSGIFVSVGYIARYITGPSLFVSFLLVVLAVLLSGFCFAEFAGKVHSAGMGYSYAYSSYGELTALVVGILTFFSYCLGTAAVARGWADYLKCFIHAASGYELPAIVTEYKLTSIINISCLAPILCLAGAWIAITGIRESAWMSRLLTVINLSIMVGFVGYGLVVHGDSANLTPFVLPDVGWMGIIKGSGLAFFCMIGWDLTCSLSDEVVESHRTLPRGIVATLLVVGVIYCSVSFTLSSIIPNDLIDISAPVATAFLSLGDKWMYLLVSFAAVTVTSANVLTGSTGPPRIIYTIAKDGLLPEIFKRIDPQSGVPRNATIVCAIVNIVASMCFDFTALASITSCFSLLVYAVVCGGLILLRVKKASSVGNPSLGLVLSLLAFIATSLSVQFEILDSSEANSSRLLAYGCGNLIAVVFVLYMVRVQKVGMLVSDTLKSSLLSQDDDIPVFADSFRCPWVPVIPLAAMWINSFMIASLGLNTFGWTMVCVVASACIYFLTRPCQ